MDYQNRYTITLTTAPCHPVLTSRKTMAINDFGTHYSALSIERMAKKRLTPNGMRGAIYHDDTFNESSTDVNSLLVFKKPTKLMTLLVACNAR